MKDHSWASRDDFDPGHPGLAKKDDPTAIDWDDLKERMREAIRAVIQECADELGLSWDDYLDRLQDVEHDESDAPAP